MNKEAREYQKKIKQFKNDLAQTIRENYALQVGMLKEAGFGHNTSVFLFQKEETHLVKLTKPTSKAHEQDMLKDIHVSHELHQHFPTPLYEKNLSGSYITPFKEFIIRISTFVPGYSAINMNLETFTQIIKLLEKIHTINPQHLSTPLEKHAGAQTHALLHGDLLPENVLISYGQISGLIDFEHAALGDPEYDLAKTTVYSLLRMETEPFSGIIDLVNRTYTAKLNKSLLTKYMKHHLNHELNITLTTSDGFDYLKRWHTSTIQKRLAELSNLL